MRSRRPPRPPCTACQPAPERREKLRALQCNGFITTRRALPSLPGIIRSAMRASILEFSKGLGGRLWEMKVRQSSLAPICVPWTVSSAAPIAAQEAAILVPGPMPPPASPWQHRQGPARPPGHRSLPGVTSATRLGSGLRSRSGTLRNRSWAPFRRPRVESGARCIALQCSTGPDRRQACKGSCDSDR